MTNIPVNLAVRNCLSLGGVIAAARKEKKISQEVLAKRAGISRHTLSGFERGENPNLSIDTFIKLTRLLNLELTIGPSKKKDIHAILKEKAEYEKRNAENHSMSS